MYYYIKALHIIFIVTWFAGLFYVVRLFIYNREANDLPLGEKEVLQRQYKIMIRRLWLGITWPSAVLTLLFGTWMGILYGSLPIWFVIKLLFVAGLFLYHLSLHRIYQQQAHSEFHYTSQQLRIWNEVATVFLFAIVFLVVVKDLLSLVWGLAGLATITIALLIAIRLYQRARKRG